MGKTCLPCYTSNFQPNPNPAQKASLIASAIAALPTHPSLYEGEKL